VSTLFADGSPEAFGRFFLPGPTEVRPEILQAQVRPMMGHRGAGVVALMEGLQAGLKDVFRTERPVFVSSSSATGLMEAAVRNGASGRILALVNGAFSERFAKIALACGLAVDRLDAPWGSAHDPDVVSEALGRGAYDAVTVVHSETSTGVLNPVERIARVVAREDDVLLLVDSVTGVGGAEVRTDAWGLDFVLTGSQKALALPPGLAFGVASERMMERAETVKARGVYFDLLAFEKNLDKMQTPNTPALSLLYALQVQLGRIRSETMERRWARHLAMAERVWTWVGAAAERLPGLRVLAPEGFRSPTVTTVVLPEGRSSRSVVEGMKARGWVIGGGYGKLEETTFRIGHMGDHTVDEVDALLADLEKVLT
jgi:predicted phosphoserine aminotransferase